MPVPSPDWAEITSAISAAVTTLIVGATAVFALRGLRDARRTRDGQLVSDLSRRWDEPLTVQAQKLFADYTTEGIVTLVHRVYEGGGATDQEVAEYTALEALPNLWKQ
jgi:hypothetical protein